MLLVLTASPPRRLFRVHTQHEIGQPNLEALARERDAGHHDPQEWSIDDIGGLAPSLSPGLNVPFQCLVELTVFFLTIPYVELDGMAQWRTWQRPAKASLSSFVSRRRTGATLEVSHLWSVDTSLWTTQSTTPGMVLSYITNGDI